MNVTVSNIVFTGCAGATLSGFNETFDSHINSTAPFFTSCHSALFTCVQSFVTFTEVTIDQYYGFAIVTIDTLGALFSDMIIKLMVHNQRQMLITRKWSTDFIYL